METQHETGAEQDKLLTALGGLLSLDATDVTSTLTLAATLIGDALNAEKIDVFLYDPLNKTLVVMGASATAMSTHQKAIGMDRLPLAGDGREVEVFQTGTSYRTEHADHDSSMLVGMTQGLGIKAQLAVPLYVMTERRGVVVAASSIPAHFSAQDLSFLEAVAAWIGSILHRAEVVEHVQNAAGERKQQHATNELIAVIARDLRAHLMPLQSRLDLVYHRVQREHRSRDEHDLAEAQGSLAHLRTMIGNLLDIGQIEQGSIALDPQPLDVVTMMQEISASFQTPTNSIHIAAPDELVITADPTRLRQAMENIIANAMQHSPQRTPIEVTVTPLKREGYAWVDITVQDYGPPLPADQLSHLFDHAETGADTTRLGLGLYLANRIVTAHNGELTVDNAVAVGARFHVRLPIRPLSNAAGDGALPRASRNVWQRDVRVSDLTDEQWETVMRVLPPRNQRGRPIGDQRRTLNGIRYVLETGCAWDKLPTRYGSYVTCWRWYIRWQSNGTWQRIQQVLTRSSTA